MANLTADMVLETLLGRYSGTNKVDAWGEATLFYNPGRVLARGTYFATVKEKNGDNDRASDLDRPGVFRLNIGADRAHFLELFGPPPARPSKGQHIEGKWDFTALDKLTPHPIYGWMSWVSVLNPGAKTFEKCLPLLDSAHAKAKATFDKRVRKLGPVSVLTV